MPNLNLMRGKVLAFDYGRKRIGVASGDLSMKIASPRAVIQNKSDLFVESELKKLFEELLPVLVVVGLPLHMSGNSGEMCKLVEKFGKMIHEKWGIQVEFIDERLSSFEAESLNRGLGGVGSREKGLIDALAAQNILQRFFDSPDVT